MTSQSFSYLSRVLAISVSGALLRRCEAGACVDPRVPRPRLLALLLYGAAFSSPLIIQLPQLPFLSPPLPAGPSGSLGDEGILGKRDVEPTDQNGCPPPVQSIIMKKDDKQKNGHNYARIEQFYEDDDDETVIHPDSQLSLPLSFHSSEIESNLGKKDFHRHLQLIIAQHSSSLRRLGT